MIRILGIDPGSRITGYGIIESSGRQHVYVTSGCIRVEADSLPERLKIIYDNIQELVTTYTPQELAVEQVFLHRNADSALKLGQARGAAICAVLSQTREVHEYAPRAIKQAIVGRGGASKEQVQHMVQVLLGLNGRPQADAADALAVALCHANTRSTPVFQSSRADRRGGRKS